MAAFPTRGYLRKLANGERIPILFKYFPFSSRVRLGWRRHESTLGIHRSSIGGALSSLITRANISGFSDEKFLGSDDDDEEFEKDELSCFRGLVLDISYRPVNVVCWRRAVCLEFMEKADVLEYYDQSVSSPQGSFYIPAVLRVPHLLQVFKRTRIKHELSRKSIFHRDSYTCQYCSAQDNLTIDHVLPISQGGVWEWENLVTACTRCNSKKGQKTLEEANMKLIKAPEAPIDSDILAMPMTGEAMRMLMRGKMVPQEWLQYLPKQKSLLCPTTNN